MLQTCFSDSVKTQNVDFQSLKWPHETCDIGSYTHMYEENVFVMFVVFRLEFLSCVIWHLLANYYSRILSAKNVFVELKPEL